MTTLAAQPHIIDAGGIKTSYLEAGSGEPVLMLHGSGPGVSATANWQYNIGALAERFHVLAPDIVGFGATERPDDVVYSLRTWTDHVWAFLDAHDIDRAAVVGNSLGGRIALQMATDHPERISRMVLMGSPGVGMTPTEGLAALRAYEPSHEAMRNLLRKFFAVDPTLITDQLVEIRYEASIADGAYEAYRAMFFDPRHKGSELGITAEEVQVIATPTLLVHGREDKVVPLTASVTMLNLLPNADLHVFSRCGHWTQIERAEEFSALVGDYLDRS
ncbi:2-hydroxymuconate-semialdehyde hydrolase/2-hydroxy-6-oxo-octa-2,4-dienoate hydrolase [Mycolicibacterium sp. BK556]|uniref:alpha/beta fold hydrolase n=1 Tax=unclassified Mycolicibacterium TaxID=2636767 RepID=UPI001613DA7E|nr:MULTISPECIES: alpha/beta fold hydrolase [unclassified Mycolicibacterium]MBB3606008.1 2-hydroxymuconate-semialdehyde hydrolase/2-hydroxy-6-oxo-octa-2,4-dienoate hydrolase [Mycolicibacterium sp. BK556]MBB3632585.1 2-hydroxymuconate-semialdehyde hydrolase/2-hydroxy-6-oxo-octa-2,4-dienoate hydrolase [Mycolicibacterium sp. BK607]